MKVQYFSSGIKVVERQISTVKKLMMLKFGASTLHQSDGSEEGLLLEMMPSLSFYSGNSTIINMFDNITFLI